MTTNEAAERLLESLALATTDNERWEAAYTALAAVRRATVERIRDTDHVILGRVLYEAGQIFVDEKQARRIAAAYDRAILDKEAAR